MQLTKSIYLSISLFLLLSLCGCSGSNAKSEPAPTRNTQASQTTPTTQEAVVYYTKSMTPEAIKKIYARVNKDISGKVALKFHRDHNYTESPKGVALFKALQSVIPNSTLVETTFGGGEKEAQEMRERFNKQGLDFAPIDVLNAQGAVAWPIPGGRQLKEAQVAKNLANYDSLVVYAPFKGDAYPGYGGALTNIGVGLQDGKGLVHGSSPKDAPEFFERMAETGKAITNHFGKRIAYIDILYNVVVKCDCNLEGCPPVNLGIVAGTDPVAVDKAALDITFAQEQHQKHDMTKKIGTLVGLYQQEYMLKLGMGTTKYKLVDIDKE